MAEGNIPQEQLARIPSRRVMEAEVLRKNREQKRPEAPKTLVMTQALIPLLDKAETKTLKAAKAREDSWRQSAVRRKIRELMRNGTKG